MAEELADAEPTAVAKVSRPAATIGNLSRSLGSVMVVGRDLLARRRAAAPQPISSAAALAVLCQDLLEHRGEASGLALASEVVEGYKAFNEGQRLEFFQRLAFDFEVDKNEILEAAERYSEQSDLDNLWAISRAVEAPRQKLFRRFNTAPDGTRTLVEMRGHLLQVLKTNPELRGVNADLRSLFISWFNKGFLELRRIDWSSPASVLEKLIAHEAVHEINGWDDLRSRLHEDRRCFGFFHPALDDDPLVFVEIALTDHIPKALAPLLKQERDPGADTEFNTVVFYSISNCHPGLSGITFGNFLIKGVVEELRKEIPTLKKFVTLSPVPGFRRWLLSANLEGLVEDNLVDRVREPVGQVVDAHVYNALLRLCAHYLIKEKSSTGRLAADSVARFHLGNGATLHSLHGSADLSTKGKEQSAGIMVNYLYDLPNIEANHEAYFDQGKIAASRSISKLAE